MDYQSMKNTVIIKIIENPAIPIWTKYNKILLRGTTSDLENNFVQISLIDTSSLLSTKMAVLIITPSFDSKFKSNIILVYL